jgi:type IV pilus assembly protein PilF
MLEDALEIALKGTGNLPAFCPGFTALGRIYTQQDDLPKAAAAFERALEIEHENLHALKGLAKVRQRQGYPDQAREHLRRALEIDPEDSGAKKLLNLLGPLPADSGQIRADEIDPTVELMGGSRPQPIPTETVADLYRKQGLLKEAEAIYRDILRIDPQRESVRAKLVELKQHISPSSQTVPSQDLNVDNAGRAERAPAAGSSLEEGPLTETAVSQATPVSTLEQWLVSIEKRRAHVR